MAEKKDRGVGGFRILQEIRGGSGSQGTVYKAVCVEDRHGLVPVGTVVALKVMPVQDDTGDQWRKLERRTQELVRLQHSNIVRYYGCFSETGDFNDLHVLVLEYLDGKTLKQWLKEDFPSGLDVDEGMRLILAALSGLSYTAQAGIIHRDIKPGNIFICKDGTVKLIDFEIARQEGGTSVSVSGNIRGSFDYMAPDFTDPSFHGDEQSDVFSLGVVMHEVLTGKTPYQRLPGDEKQANFAFLARWAKSGDGQTVNPIRISSRIRRLLAHADEVLLRALAPKREERYPDFASFAADCRNIRFRDLKNGENTYRMLQYIGKGGFGEVFKARFRQTRQLVAVKHLLKDSYADRFNREARTLKKLKDPCFVQFVDFFFIESGDVKHREAFLVMAFLDGMPGNSLRDAIRESGTGLPPKDVFLAFGRYAYGLSLMHRQGIYHRDIKPSNLYYPRGAPGKSAIMDFGIIRDIHGTQTKDGGVPGTFDYMPPEVILTKNRGDARMDIFALGLCLYEALTGKTGYPRLPPGNAALPAFLERAKNGEPPVFDDPRVQGSHDILALLCDMTNPSADLRVGEVRQVVSRLKELALKVDPINPPVIPDEPEPDETSPSTVTEPEPGTHPTTVTRPDNPDVDDELERERASARLRYWVRVAVVMIAVSGGVAGMVFGVAVFQKSRAAREKTAIVNGYTKYEFTEDIEGTEKGELDRRREEWQKIWNPSLSSWWKRLPKEQFGSWVAELDSAKSKCDKIIDENRKSIRIIEGSVLDAKALVLQFEAASDGEAWDKAEEDRLRRMGKWDRDLLGDKYKELQETVLTARNKAKMRIDRLKECEDAAKAVEGVFTDAGDETALNASAARWKGWQEKWSQEQELDKDAYAELDGRIQSAHDSAQKRIEAAALGRILSECRAGADKIKDVFGKVDARASMWAAEDEWKSWRDRWAREQKLDADTYAGLDRQIQSAYDAAEERVVKREAAFARQRKIEESEAAKKAVVNACDTATDNGILAAAKEDWEKWRQKWRGEIDDNEYNVRDWQIQVAYDAARTRIDQVHNQKVQACLKEVNTILTAFAAVKTQDGLRQTEENWQAWQGRWTAQIDDKVYQGFDQRIRTARDDAGKAITIAEASETSQKMVVFFERVAGRDGLLKGDGARTVWQNTWRLKLDAAKYAELDARIGAARTDAEKRVKAAEQEQLSAACRKAAADLVAHFAQTNTRDELTKANDAWQAWRNEWEQKVDAKLYAELDGKIQTECGTAEHRIVDAEEAKKLALLKKECEGTAAKLKGNFRSATDEAGLTEANQALRSWQDEWKQKKVDGYVNLVKEIQVERNAAEARVSCKSSAEKLANVYNKVNEREDLTKADDSWQTWQNEWKQKVDAGLYSGLDGNVQAVRDEAEKRVEKVELARRLAACQEAAGEVARTFRSVETGPELDKADATHRDWQERWKGLDGQAGYTKAAGEIAEAKAGAEKRLREIERKRQNILKVYEEAVKDEPVASRRKRLDDAKGMIEASRKEKLFSEEETERRLAEIETRQAWTVGKISNRTEDAVVVGEGKVPVQSGETVTVVFKEGMSWTAVRRGYDPVTVMRSELDGKTVELSAGRFIPSDVTVRLPQGLDAGVVCEFDGTAVSTEGKVVKPGQYTCAYRRAGYDKQEGLRFTVKVGETDARFPEPGTWVASPVEVTVPELGGGVICEMKLDGVVRQVSESFSLRPLSGKKYTCVYKRTGYYEQEKPFELSVGENANLPSPTKWIPLPVKVTVPKLDSGVSCEVAGNARQAGEEFELAPNELPYRYVYRKTDYEDQSGQLNVEVNRPFALPVPGGWLPTLGLRTLLDAEKAVNHREWDRADGLLKQADVQDKANKDLKAKLETQVANSKMWGKTLDEMDNLVRNKEDGRDSIEILRMYLQIVKLEYRLTDDDKNRIREMYRFGERDFKEKIESKRMGNSAEEYLKRLKNDFEQLLPGEEP